LKKHTYRVNKVKTRHHILKEALPYVEQLQKLPFISLIVPDVINNNSHGRNRMKISTTTRSGFDLTFGGAGAQKFHIVCPVTEENRLEIERTIIKVAEGG